MCLIKAAMEKNGQIDPQKCGEIRPKNEVIIVEQAGEFRKGQIGKFEREFGLFSLF